MPAADAAEVTVVGGGIAGLVVARRLAMDGLRVRLLEASDRLGGTLQSHTVGGLLLDAGPESFATRGGSVAALLGELGLASEIVAPTEAQAWLQQDADRAVPLPLTSRLGIPAIPAASDVVAAVGWAAALRAQLDTLMPALAMKPDLTLGELVRRRMGRGVLERLVAPVALGVYSKHPDELVADRVLPGLRAAVTQEGSLGAAVRADEASAPGRAVAGIRGGVARLASELAADLVIFRADVRLGTRVERLDDLGPEHGRIVVAAPGLLGPAPESVDVHLATIVTEPDAALAADPRGSGVLVTPGIPGVHAKALTHLTAKWPWLRERSEGREALRLSYAQQPDPGTVHADAERLLGVRIAPERILETALVSWSRAAQLPAAQVEAAPARVSVVGEQVAGAGIASIVAQAERVATAIRDEVLDSRKRDERERMER